MINYNELFNIFYSDLPESVKISILENLPEEALLEGLNESVDTYRPILEVLDILAYSEDTTEEKANAVIDEIFSGIDEQVAEEILEAYAKEKFIQYIRESVAYGNDSIGLRRALKIANIKSAINKPVETKKEEPKPKKQLSSLERIYKKHDIEKKQQAEERNKNLQRDYVLLGKEIEAMEGKPSMLAQKQEKMKKRAELQKKLQELQTVKANEALTDVAYLLAHTNISESLEVSEACFDEIMGIVEEILSEKIYKSKKDAPKKPLTKINNTKYSMTEKTKPSKKTESPVYTTKMKIDRDINTKGYEEQRDADSEYSSTYNRKSKNPPNYKIMDAGAGSIGYDNGYNNSQDRREAEEFTNARSINKHYRKNGNIKTGRDSALAYNAKKKLKEYRKKHDLDNHLKNAIRSARHREIMADYYDMAK